MKANAIREVSSRLVLLIPEYRVVAVSKLKAYLMLSPRLEANRYEGPVGFRMERDPRE
jgi:hypothetical protein